MIIIQKHNQENHYFELFKEQMLNTQLRANNITDERILSAFKTVPREKYVFDDQKAICYSEQLIALKNKRFLLPALTFAQMLQQTPINNAKNILIIGAGLGYSLEILFKMNLHAVALEHNHFVETVAKKNPHLSNHFKVGSLISGIPELSPFDIIFIEGGINCIPTNLVKQLKPGGFLTTLIKKKGIYHCTTFSKINNHLNPIASSSSTGYLLPDFKKENNFDFND